MNAVTIWFWGLAQRLLGRLGKPTRIAAERVIPITVDELPRPRRSEPPPLACPACGLRVTGLRPLVGSQATGQPICCCSGCAHLVRYDGERLRSLTTDELRQVMRSRGWPTLERFMRRIRLARWTVLVRRDPKGAAS